MTRRRVSADIDVTRGAMRLEKTGGELVTACMAFPCAGRWCHLLADPPAWLAWLFRLEWTAPFKMARPVGREEKSFKLRCLHCGHWFAAKRSTAMYCSNKCRLAANRLHHA